MNDSISQYLTDDHRRCDHLLAACEAATSAQVWPSLDEAAETLVGAMERHFRIEEEVLFPELEQASGQAGGPVAVMRMEHEQMRLLLAELATVVRQRDRDGSFGVLETLHMFTLQHNTKEEGILYPLADRTLTDTAPTITARMKEV